MIKAAVAKEPLRGQSAVFADIPASKTGEHVLNEHVRHNHKWPHVIFGRILRFIGWAIGFGGLYATFSACPFCGQPGCPVGAGTTGIIGGFFALCMQIWNIPVKRLKNLFRRKREKTIVEHEKMLTL